jgi:transcriptional/translational regulatory protein YebC/TACO1
MIDAGAEDVSFEEEGYITVYCAVVDFGAMQKKIESLPLDVESAELQRIPKTTVHLDTEAAKKVMKLIDVFEDDDDVQKVFHNLELTEEQMAELA